MLGGGVLAGDAARLAAVLDPDFLAEADWDPGSRVLSLPAGHPLLGRQVCRTAGCTATAHGSGNGGLCYQCSSRLARAGWTPEEIRSAAELPPLPARPPGCLVPGCQRMSPGGRQGQRTGRSLPGASAGGFPISTVSSAPRRVCQNPPGPAPDDPKAPAAPPRNATG